VVNEMILYILKRLLLMIPTLIGILFFTFLIIQFVPGGPVEQLVNKLSGLNAITESSSASNLYRGSNGLSEDRFLIMMSNYTVFDLGMSYFHNQSVGELILSKLPVSITLGLWSFIIVYAVSIPLGIKKAINDGSNFDIVSSTIVLIGYSIPGFVLGIGLIVLLGGGSFFDIFPTRGLVSDNWSDLTFFGKITDYLWHITLPIICLVIGSFAVMTMLTKNSFIDEINKLYVVTARAKGLSENRILYSHVFKNAIIPILTGFPAQFVSAFFTGSILIETIFSLDGIGLLSYEAIIQRDYPVVMGTLFIFTLIGLLTKLFTDIMYVYVDPRIKFSSSDAQRNA
jgi:microcin C transport system permease protein